MHVLAVCLPGPAPGQRFLVVGMGLGSAWASAAGRAGTRSFWPSGLHDGGIKVVVRRWTLILRSAAGADVPFPVSKIHARGIPLRPCNTPAASRPATRPGRSSSPPRPPGRCLFS